MAVLTDAALSTESDIIKNETTAGANSADRIGQMIEDLIDSKTNNTNPAVYRALLTQASTGAPTATVLENTIGTISFSRSGVGIYSVNSTTLFTTNKTMPSPQYSTIRIGANYTSIDVELNTTSAIAIQTYLQGTASDDVLAKFPIEILVYL